MRANYGSDVIQPVRKLPTADQLPVGEIGPGRSGSGNPIGRAAR